VRPPVLFLADTARERRSLLCERGAGVARRGHSILYAGKANGKSCRCRTLGHSVVMGSSCRRCSWIAWLGLLFLDGGGASLLALLVLWLRRWRRSGVKYIRGPLHLRAGCAYASEVRRVALLRRWTRRLPRWPRNPRRRSCLPSAELGQREVVICCCWLWDASLRGRAIVVGRR